MLHEESDLRRSCAARRPTRVHSPRHAPCLVVLTCSLGLLASHGCGSSDKDKLFPVSGKVTLNGAPLTGGQVAFHPDLSKGNNARGIPTGPIGSDGAYSLSTDGKSGAPVGIYKVSVTTNFPGATGTPVPINPRYNDPNRSGLTCEVLPSPADGAYDLKVTR